MASISNVNSDSTASAGLNRGLVIPVLAGVLGVLFLSSAYLGIVTLAQGWKHAVELFWQDKLLVVPIIAGFGTQIGLYTFLKVGLRAASRGAGTMAGQPAKPAIPPGDLTRTNEGEAVTFAIKPLNLGSGAATLDFDVSMSTHSVELGAFDLSRLAVLKTDTGAEIQPSAYKGSSGHHVEGKLSFPADRLAEAKTLTLVIKNVAGVVERTFAWNLQ